MKPGLIDAIYLLNRQCILEKNKICEISNLSQQEFVIMDLLDTDEKISCNSISKRILLSESRTSRLIESLVKKNYLIRKNDPDNRRCISVYFSKKGLKVKKNIEDLKIRCEKRIVSKIESGDLETVMKSIKILSEVIDKEQGDF